MSEFKDHFSSQSGLYCSHRPEYPPELYKYLNSLCDVHDIAWDCATGSGQAARGLAPYFKRVYATDASVQQIQNASGQSNVDFRVADASNSGLEDRSVDLVTVAQALHWFDLNDFYAEVRRVLKPDGILAVWCYGLMEIDDNVDPLFLEFYNDVVGPFWPPERVHIERGYSDLSFPFKRIPTPKFNMITIWSLDDFLGYLKTWSATARFIEQNKQNPVDMWSEKFKSAWGGDAKKEIVWPVTVLVGKGNSCK